MTINDHSPPPRRCLGVTAKNRPCRAWAVIGTHYCSHHAHQARTLSAGRPTDPTRPGSITIDDLIDDMLQKLSFISVWLERMEEGDDFIKLFSAYSRGATHLASLLRQKRLLPDRSADDFMSAIDQALDEIAEELDIKL